MGGSVSGLKKLVFLRMSALVFAALVTLPQNVDAQSSGSDTTSTGQILTVTLTSPSDGAVFSGPPPCSTDVTGLVTLSAARDTAVNILYVIDVSGSTTDPTFHPPIDVDGDGRVDEADDLNRDGVNGDILDAEIAGVLALNGSIVDAKNVHVGVIVYASAAAGTDVSPESGPQAFTLPSADRNSNDIPDLEEVLRSIDSEIVTGGSVGLFTSFDQDSLGNSTNFEAALQALLSTFADRPAGEKNIAFFLSDGNNEIGGPIADLLEQAADSDLVIHSIGITSSSNADELAAIAEATGGQFVQVDDPTELRATLPTLPVIGISEVTVNGQIVELSPVGTFATTVLLPGGEQSLIARAVADDQTSVSAQVTVTCGTPLTCQVEITSPEQGTLVCEDSLEVSGTFQTSGALGTVTTNCEVNGFAADLSADGRFQVVVPCPSDSNRVVVVCTVTDEFGGLAVCRDTVEVECATETVCEVEIIRPIDGAVVELDRVDVFGSLRVPGGQPPFFVECEVNGQLIPTLGGDFTGTVLCSPGENTITVTCRFLDACGNLVECSDSVRVFCDFDTLACKVDITSPEEGAVVCGDSVTVNLAPDVMPSILPPTVLVCDVNGVVVRAPPLAPLVSVRIPVTPGENVVVAHCTIFDIAGNRSVCADTSRFTVDSQPVCEVEILSPENGTFSCEDTVSVVALTRARGAPPLDLTLELNGQTIQPPDSVVAAYLPLQSGANVIVARCSVRDSCGAESSAADSIAVFLDDAPPTCSFFPTGLAIQGSFFDEHSGVAEIVPQSLRNANLILDSFEPGQKSVDFRLELIDPTKAMSFVIDVLDSCGNRFRCDPVFLTLPSDRADRSFELTFPEIDRYFQLTNSGLTEIRLELNGRRFRLTTDPAGPEHESNTFLIKREGRTTIDLLRYLDRQENNLTIVYEGPPGSSAEVFLTNAVEAVDFVLELIDLPQEYLLSQNYPNPFNPSTKIRFDIPARHSEGVEATLSIYNLLGVNIRTLLHERKFPGQYTVEWDGRDERGLPVSSGLYIFKLSASDFTHSRRMLLLK